MHGLIESLDDVEAYANRQAVTNPSIASGIALRGPGLNDLQLAELRRALPRLPKNYLTIARRWKLDKVSIGLLNLCPPGFGRATDLVSCLVAADSPINPLSRMIEESSLVEVASFEGDPVCLGLEGSIRVGHVFRFALAEDATMYPRFVARSFEDLLKGATELHARLMPDPEMASVEDVILAVRRYIPEEALEEWRILARVSGAGN
jgi:hypothetical protein